MLPFFLINSLFLDYFVFQFFSTQETIALDEALHF